MQSATLIYNDRINLHRRMVDIDAIIDQKPTPQLVKELAEARIRNLMCFRELQAYNDTGTFLHKHPLLTTRTEYDELLELFKNDPEAFLNEHKLSKDNINRYRSRINSGKYNDEKNRQFRELITKHEQRVELIHKIMHKHR